MVRAQEVADHLKAVKGGTGDTTLRWKHTWKTGCARDARTQCPKTGPSPWSGLITFEGAAPGVGLPEAVAGLTIGLPMAIQEPAGIEIPTARISREEWVTGARQVPKHERART